LCGKETCGPLNITESYVYKTAVCWDITPCGVTCLFWRFEETCCLHFQGDWNRFKWLLKLPKLIHSARGHRQHFPPNY
jgi:hypothetical protein